MASVGAYEVDRRRARYAGDDVILIPGPGALCAIRHGGGSCGSIRTVLRRGLAFGFGGHEMTVVVPDGVRALRARLPQHPWRIYPVKDNVAELPSPGYHYRFVR